MGCGVACSSGRAGLSAASAGGGTGAGSTPGPSLIGRSCSAIVPQTSVIREQYAAYYRRLPSSWKPRNDRGHLMAAFLGTFALALALAVALYGAVASFVGGRKGSSL